MARRSPPLPRRRPRASRCAVNAAAHRGMLAAQAALYGEGEPVTFEAAMAERAQWAAEDEAKRHAQACLSLEVRR